MGRDGHFDKSCLYSTVRNESGGDMRFGFLPPHGVLLEDDQEYTVFGNILDAVGRGDRVTDRRNNQALVDAIDRGDLVIVSTPAPILQDAVTEATKVLRLSSGSLSAASPCWETSDSADYPVAA